MSSNILMLVSLALGFSAFVLYLRDTIKGNTRPHIYTWFIFSLQGMIHFAISSDEKLAVVNLMALFLCIFSTIIVLITIKNRLKEIAVNDGKYIGIASIILLIWIFISSPILSNILLLLTVLFSLLPTMRKAWIHPNSESLITYILFFLSTSFFLFTLDILSDPNAISIFGISIILLIFCNLIIIRRLQTK